ncbi:MAG: hypothetical protein IT318_17540 [Anaerolineales bacterium]|nr:hypothetical protein [Anaerolineales bacterium]
MPRASLWFIRTGLLALAAGFTLGALLLLNKGLPIYPGLWRLLPAHIELLLVGWTLNLALGVAYWILPRFIRGAPRGPGWPVWAAYGLLNVGVILACVEPWVASGPWLASVGRALEALAAGFFAVHAWPRVKPHGV